MPKMVARVRISKERVIVTQKIRIKVCFLMVTDIRTIRVILYLLSLLVHHYQDNIFKNKHIRIKIQSLLYHYFIVANCFAINCSSK